jgi:hypothetical protein
MGVGEPSSPGGVRIQHGPPAVGARQTCSVGGSARHAERSRRPQTVSLRRPLSRLARRIALPPLVAIRARNPWVLARLRVFGWYVRFTVNRPFVVPRRRAAVARDAPAGVLTGWSRGNRPSDARRDSQIATSRCGHNGVRSNDQVATCVPHLWTTLWTVPPGGVRRSRWNKAMGCGRAVPRRCVSRSRKRHGKCGFRASNLSR